MTVAIWWIRRDLRVHDNQALHQALGSAECVLPLFVFDPQLLASPTRSERRVHFLLRALHNLDSELRRRGSRLFVRFGDPRDVIPSVVRECQARIVVAEADYTPYARKRDEAVARLVPLVLTSGLTIHPPGSVLSGTGQPYTVYSQFARAWWTLRQPAVTDLHPAPARLPLCSLVSSEPLPEPPNSPPDQFPPSEAQARRRLEQFLQTRLVSYSEGRNRLDGSGSSQLSPYFRFGLISVREAWCLALPYLDHPETANGARAWLNELVWREFYQHLLAAFPESVQLSMRTTFRAQEWPGSLADFDAWREGSTGFPVIDAAMRQLNAEGWISNRARMIVANFLTKLLLNDWRHGERHFRRQLLDGDLAANVGGWQWSAGTGTDAAPYFRIFNPVRQGELFDPDGNWIRRWVPELQGVPQQYLYAPWQMPSSVQQAAGCIIGRHYPAPIVDYGRARQRALEWFQRRSRDDYSQVQEF
ncbi:MAG: cryptochrome/photolyase family protein [Thermomicrobium sp.]